LNGDLKQQEEVTPTNTAASNIKNRLATVNSVKLTGRDQDHVKQSIISMSEILSSRNEALEN
jgi:hypothetical protein